MQKWVNVYGHSKEQASSIKKYSVVAKLQVVFKNRFLYKVCVRDASRTIVFEHATSTEY